jgi:hypothetical protein
MVLDVSTGSDWYLLFRLVHVRLVAAMGIKGFSDECVPHLDFFVSGCGVAEAAGLVFTLAGGGLLRLWPA